MSDVVRNATGGAATGGGGVLSNARVPVLGFIAPSGTGKTTLLREIITRLRDRGLRVGVVKQARDDFDVDHPEKDSYRLRKAGIERLLINSPQQSALILEHPGGDDPQLNELLALLRQEELDLILVEGFTDQDFPKIELSRAGSRFSRYPHDPSVIALVSDRAGEVAASVPVLDIDAPGALVDFVLGRLGLWPGSEFWELNR